MIIHYLNIFKNVLTLTLYTLSKAPILNYDYKINSIHLYSIPTKFGVLQGSYGFSGAGAFHFFSYLVGKYICFWDIKKREMLGVLKLLPRESYLLMWQYDVALKK
jgi:hypothetical protein